MTNEELTMAILKSAEAIKKDIQPNELLDYITNLQTIEQQYSAILSENAELENKITNLQEENEKLQKELDYANNDNIYYIAKIDKAIGELDKYINSCGIEAEHTLNNEKCLISVRHSKKVKNILGGDDNE